MVLNRLDIPEYVEDLDWVCSLPLDWGPLEGRTIAISGATGMIGAFLVDVIMRKNDTEEFDCTVVALGRSGRKARERLPYFGCSGFVFEEIDVSAPMALPTAEADHVVHLASTTHPVAYATDPVGTIASNINGLQNLLNYHCACRSAGRAGRFVFASSVEVFGENRGDVGSFNESYCGYIDCNTLRAGYPEAKRLGEAMCQAYRSQHGVHVVIPRLPRTYGATMQWTDTKAVAQFIKKAVAGENIVLKSTGTQLYSYLNVCDTVCGLLWVMLCGESGEAYNVADSASNMTLRELASIAASAADVDVILDLPSEAERAGYSTATQAVMDNHKLRALGWEAKYDLRNGMTRSIEMLRSGRKA